MVEEEVTTVRIRKANYERITKYGEYGDSFDDVITKILDKIEKGRR